MAGLVGQATGQSVIKGSRFVDSLKQRLAEATTAQDQVHFLLALTRSSADTTEAGNYASRALETAELSRDRRLIIGSYIAIGESYLDRPGLAGNQVKAIGYYERAAASARNNGLESLLSDSYCHLSSAWRYRGDLEKALGYSNQALAIASSMDNDSSRVLALLSLGGVYMDMNDALLAMRNLLDAMDMAERTGNDELLREVDSQMDFFYDGIGEYDKAIDYRMKALAIDRKYWKGHYMLIDQYRLGDLFGQEKQQDLALRMYERSLALTDTLHYDMMKFNSYVRIFNMYFLNNQHQKALRFIQEHPVELDKLRILGFQFFIDEAYAMSYSEQGKDDSANFYFRKAEPGVEQNAGPELRFGFYTAFADFFRKGKDYPHAIAYSQKAEQLAQSIKDLSLTASSAQQLDTLYELAGDYKTAFLYNTLYNTYKDSLQTLGHATDLQKLEVENDNRRRERLAREEELRTEHRHNIQYMGFTVGIVLLFILLVMLGWFAVPAGVIRILGFLSFIFFFEFIILLMDKQIIGWTHEEPWKILLIKIVLAAGLVPLHHWLEHKVIHYLSHRKFRPVNAPPAVAGVEPAVAEVKPVLAEVKPATEA